MLPKDSIDLSNIDKLLRGSNYEFGDDKPDYITESAYRYGKPDTTKKDNIPVRISNKLLQQNHYNFGHDSEPWDTTQNRAYTPKRIDNEINNIDLTKTNLILGDDKPNLRSISNDTYIEFPCQYVPVDQNHVRYLHSHHFQLGNNPNNEFQSQNHEDYKDPNSYKGEFKPVKIDNSLRVTNWSMGDSKPSEIYNTTYKIVHTPKKGDREPNIIRKSALNLIGNNPMDYKTDYSDNYIPLKRNVNDNDKLKDLMSTIRNSHFSLGQMENDYNTMNNIAYKAYPNMKSYKKGLANDALNYLKNAHFKLGYDNEIGISTQKKDFIPYELSGLNLSRNLRSESHDFGDKNKFEGISIYTSDYTKKEIPNDGNDCCC